MLCSRAITQRCPSNTYSPVVPGIGHEGHGGIGSRCSSAKTQRRRPTAGHNQSGRSATFSTGGRVRSFAYPAQVTSWMRRRDHNIFANATSLLICGLLAGVVVAAAAFPAAAMSGLAAKAGGADVRELPSELKDFSSPQITRIYASDGKTQISQFYDEFRSDVPLKDISPYMQNAIVAAEDREFYHHNGVDLKGVARAFVNNNNGKLQAGRLDDHHAVRADVAGLLGDQPAGGRRRDRGHPEAQDHRDEVRAAGREGAHQGPDPRALPEHRAVRQPGVRRLRRQPGLLQQEAEGPRRSARPRCWPAWSRRPTSFNPTTADGLPADPGPPQQLRHPRHGRRWARSPRPQADKALKEPIPTQGQAGRQRLRLGRQEQLGLLLRLLLPLVDEPAGVRRHDVRPGAAPQERRLPDRHLARRQGAGRRPASEITERDHGHEQERAAAGRGRARHRQGAGAGRQPQVQAGRPGAPAEQALVRPGARPRKGIRGYLPEHHEPADHRRRRHQRLPGRLGVQDVHHGRRAGEGLSRSATRSTRRSRYKSALHHRPEQPVGLPGHALLVPGQRRRRARPASTTCGPASATR